jgi:hypothetical protein
MSKVVGASASIVALCGGSHFFFRTECANVRFEDSEKSVIRNTRTLNNRAFVSNCGPRQQRDKYSVCSESKRQTQEQIYSK